MPRRGRSCGPRGPSVARSMRSSRGTRPTEPPTAARCPRLVPTRWSWPPHGWFPPVAPVRSRGVRRVDERDDFLSRRRTAAIDECDRLAEHSLSVLLGIPDGRAGANELRGAAIESTDPVETADDVGHVAAEDPAVLVQLIDDDVAEVLEQT